MVRFETVLWKRFPLEEICSHALTPVKLMQLYDVHVLALPKSKIHIPGNIQNPSLTNLLLHSKVE